MRAMYCRWRETLLMRTYNDVAASCGVSAGVTLVKMTGYLVTLSYVNVTDDTCTGRKTRRCATFNSFCYFFAQSTCRHFSVFIIRDTIHSWTSMVPVY